MSEMANAMWDCKTAVSGGADGAHVRGEGYDIRGNSQYET